VNAKATFFALVTTALLAACTKDKTAQPPEEKAPAEHTDETPHADEPEHEPLPKRVRLSPQVITDANIKTAPIGREALRAALELPGEIAANPDKMAKIATPVAGRIERVAFTEGGMVKARDLLATIRVTDLPDRQSAFASASARASAAKANAERLEALTQKGLASAQELADAKAQAQALGAQERAAAERLRVLGVGPGGKAGSILEIRAPISGTVVSRNAVTGQPLGAEDVIATIVDLDELWFLGRVFEHDLSRVELGAMTEVQLNAFPGEHFEGTVAYIGRQIDPVARTVIARIPLKNRDGKLRLGLFGTARVAVGKDPSRAPALVVPRSAITDIGGKSVVFVRHPDDDFEVHEVVLGRSGLGKVEVLSGLREGEQVVTDGVFSLKSLVLKSTIAEEEE